MDINKRFQKLLFVGGDRRQIRAVNRVAESGREVGVFGYDNTDADKFSERVCQDINLYEIKNEYKTIVLPLPYTLDGKFVNTMSDKIKIEISELLQNFAKDSVILAGKCNRDFVKLAENKDFCIVDYFEREELQILNAIPTAEGAIQIAMQEVPFTIHSSKCLIIGNGRIGKILAKMLTGIGADVTVAARKSRDRATLFSFGVKGISTSELYENIGRFDIIFNTVPNLMIDADMLAKTSRNALVVDLASVPGGVDFEAARKMGIKVIWALSLPGKVAPDTAGDIIGKTLLNILDELEVK